MIYQTTGKWWATKATTPLRNQHHLHKLEKRYNKYYPYIDPVLWQHKDIIFSGNDKCIEATHFCILSKALTNRLGLTRHYPKIVYTAEDPKNIYRDLAGLKFCGVRINNFMINWYKEPVIIIVNPFEFLSMHLKRTIW